MLIVQFTLALLPNASIETAYAIDTTPTPVPTSPAPTSVVTVDQIGAVSQQVAQAIQDTTLSADAKAQRVTALAAQFNQLVVQWQQQVNQTVSAVQAIAVAASQPTPTPAPANPLGTPTPVPGTAPVPSTGQTADQLRAQIASLSQQMAQVTQDPSLTPDARSAELKALGQQFDQLVQQLQRLGG